MSRGRFTTRLARPRSTRTATAERGGGPAGRQWLRFCGRIAIAGSPHRASGCECRRDGIARFSFRIAADSFLKKENRRNRYIIIILISTASHISADRSSHMPAVVPIRIGSSSFPPRPWLPSAISSRRVATDARPVDSGDSGSVLRARLARA